MKKPFIQPISLMVLLATLTSLPSASADGPKPIDVEVLRQVSSARAAKNTQETGTFLGFVLPAVGMVTVLSKSGRSEKLLMKYGLPLWGIAVANLTIANVLSATSDHREYRAGDEIAFWREFYKDMATLSHLYPEQIEMARQKGKFSTVAEVAASFRLQAGQKLNLGEFAGWYQQMLSVMPILEDSSEAEAKAFAEWAAARADEALGSFASVFSQDASDLENNRLHLQQTLLFTGFIISGLLD